MPKVSADQVYALLSKHMLTQEQREVVEGAPLDSPALVIAGAGSGKTELMTVRVLYLVANGFAKPHEILGLTFTRKAASELRNRVSSALYKLRESELWPQDLDFDFAEANITTYNSFGNDIFRKLSLAIGYEQDAALISEAAAFGLADELLTGLGPDLVSDLDQWDKTKSYLVELILQLNGELTDNQATSLQMQELLQEFSNHVSSLPQTESGSMARYAYTQEMLDGAAQNEMLAELAERYRLLKAKRHLVDFSDQVALALQATAGNRDHEYRFVMLDEYQDTSSIQTQLLARLFAGSSVLAVGDPNQAIYGWRGASSNNLANFHIDFLSKVPTTFTLSRSWRSGPAVVAAANQLTIELNMAQPELVPVELVPGNSEMRDQVLAQVFADEATEAKAISQWLSQELTADRSAALLVRTKSSMQILADALSAKGLSFEVTGLSSLIQLPEIVDLVSALQVIERPQAGAHLMRLLAGAKWRIGPRDLAELNALAKKLSRIRKAPKALPLTIVEALDELRFASTKDLANFSEVGLTRMTQAAELFHSLRLKSSLTLTELSWAVVRELGIDIELFAHSNSKNPLINLEAFIAKISEFEASSMRPTLANLLSWLDQAVEKESFELPKSGAKKGVVQLMTVHAAKGLEWDLVAVAQLNQGSFPIESRSAKGWLASGRLPFQLRGDKAALPSFEFRTARTQKELKKAFDEFQQANRAKSLLEEKRLAYVALTRAKEKLFLTASHYKASAGKPRAISPFLQELLDTDLARLVEPVPDIPTVNPLDEQQQELIWPADPLGSRRQSVTEAANNIVRSKPDQIQNFTELTLLLEERERGNWLTGPQLPARISVSRLVSLLADPAKFADYLSRPEPQLFDQNAARGTAFHARLEDMFTSGRELELEDWASEDVELGVNFSDSRFGAMQPSWVEQSIEFRLADLVVVCKIDAIFETEWGYEIVDWKSGAAPKDSEQLQSRSIQLALYKIAFAKWQNVQLERIRASFFFAKDGKEVSPADLPTETELVAAIEAARTARRD